MAKYNLIKIFQIITYLQYSFGFLAIFNGVLSTYLPPKITSALESGKNDFFKFGEAEHFLTDLAYNSHTSESSSNYDITSVDYPHSYLLESFTAEAPNLEVIFSHPIIDQSSGHSLAQDQSYHNNKVDLLLKNQAKKENNLFDYKSVARAEKYALVPMESEHDPLQSPINEVKWYVNDFKNIYQTNLSQQQNSCDNNSDFNYKFKSENGREKPFNLGSITGPELLTQLPPKCNFNELQNLYSGENLVKTTLNQHETSSSQSHSNKNKHNSNSKWLEGFKELFQNTDKTYITIDETTSSHELHVPLPPKDDFTMQRSQYFEEILPNIPPNKQEISLSPSHSNNDKHSNDLKQLKGFNEIFPSTDKSYIFLDEALDTHDFHTQLQSSDNFNVHDSQYAGENVSSTTSNQDEISSLSSRFNNNKHGNNSKQFVGFKNVLSDTYNTYINYDEALIPHNFHSKLPENYIFNVHESQYSGETFEKTPSNQHTTSLSYSHSRSNNNKHNKYSEWLKGFDEIFPKTDNTNVSLDEVLSSHELHSQLTSNNNFNAHKSRIAREKFSSTNLNPCEISLMPNHINKNKYLNNSEQFEDFENKLSDTYKTYIALDETLSPQILHSQLSPNYNSNEHQSQNSGEILATDPSNQYGASLSQSHSQKNRQRKKLKWLEGYNDIFFGTDNSYILLDKTMVNHDLHSQLPPNENLKVHQIQNFRENQASNLSGQYQLLPSQSHINKNEQNKKLKLLKSCDEMFPKIDNAYIHLDGIINYDEVNSQLPLNNISVFHPSQYDGVYLASNNLNQPQKSSSPYHSSNFKYKNNPKWLEGFNDVFQTPYNTHNQMNKALVSPEIYSKYKTNNKKNVIGLHGASSSQHHNQHTNILDWNNGNLAQNSPTEGKLKFEQNIYSVLEHKSNINEKNTDQLKEKEKFAAHKSDRLHKEDLNDNKDKEEDNANSKFLKDSEIIIDSSEVYSTKQKKRKYKSFRSKSRKKIMVKSTES
ncbi:hypothetical protein BY996DRAFT_6413758 [Phakopsora pachyrhizi]|uniref:Expressed protein n=1 Tax=Phakopsora pachyrhizi TaxID=170000 RepID=A0AAV0BPF7_PHAPC|nr:hypothetical protein BY996DRAFT_6413758 [Phakopsora pachyrhizi]CAH7688064.1 expressed protein [Phakopsora pachyrhizi]